MRGIKAEDFQRSFSDEGAVLFVLPESS